MSNTKGHYFLSLDGLRGIAAFAVVIFHRRAWFGPDNGEHVVGHAYLAVDFFFMLSGFVLASSYQERLRLDMSFGDFFTRRIIRLYPLVVFSVMLGALAAFGSMHSGKTPHNPYFELDIVSTSLIIPNFWEHEYFRLNGPLWSLFWEMVASILFGLFGAKLRTRYFLAGVIISEVIFIYAQFHYNSPFIGVYPTGFIFGLARIITAFGSGVLLFRLYETGRFADFNIGLFAPVLLLASFQSMPLHHPSKLIYNIGIVTFLYPLIVFGSARHKPVFPKFNQISGNISYPLYVLHDPLLLLISASLIVTHISTNNSGPIEGFLRLATTIGISWLCFKFFDLPMRQQLSRWLKTRNFSPAVQ